MKLVKTTPVASLYYLNPTERLLLESVLQKFPFTDHYPGQISHEPRDSQTAEREKLLNDSLKEHRRDLTRSARKLMAAEKLQPWKKGHLLALTMEDRENLLQILNDIRIGCWHSLGDPEVLETNNTEMSDQEFAWRNLMHLAGYFELYLVEDGGTEP